MRTLAAVALSWLHQLALSLWLGGILILGAVAAPAVFGTAKAHGDTARGMPLYTFAGEAMGVAFQRFNTLVLVAGALMLLAGLAYGSLAGLCPVRLRVRAALTAVCWGIALWMALSLFPQMEAARAQGQMDAFDGFHQWSRLAFQAEALLLLAVTALTGWLHLDRSPHAEGAVTVPAAYHSVA